MTAPIIAVHRRNKLEQLASVARGNWIEIDVDFMDGEACLSHDPPHKSPAPEKLVDFLPRALEAGVGGFIFDCKRENVEKAIRPLIEKYGVDSYFYLNEMDIQADIYLAANPKHRTAMRVWRYRPARDVIRYVEDAKAVGQAYPAWIWADCWQRELAQDIGKPFVPLNQADAHKLQRLGVKLCVCSPELYMHDYDKTYDANAIEAIYRGVVRYRQRLMQTGVSADAVCTKFPWLWTYDVDVLDKAATLGDLPK